MRRLVVACVLVATVRVAAAERVLLLLRGAGAADTDETAVLEAASIYIRDLALHIEVRSGAAPGEISGASLGGVVERVLADGARLAFWTVPADDISAPGVILYAVAASPGSPPVIDALPVLGPPGAERNRAVALKLRALLTGAAREEPRLPTPQPVLAPPPAPASAPPIAIVTPPVLKPRSSKPFALFAAGYWLTVPASGELTRQGVAVEAVRPWSGFELTLGSEVVSKPVLRSAAGISTLVDVPIRVGGRLMLRRGRHTLGVSALLSLHILSATGLSTDGSGGSALKLAGGIGGGIVLRRELTAHMSGELRILTERLLPRTRFLIRGTPALDTDAILFGFGAALVFAP